MIRILQKLCFHKPYIEGMETYLLMKNWHMHCLQMVTLYIFLLHKL